MEKHKGEKPFECAQCDYRRLPHMQLHTGDKPYKRSLWFLVNNTYTQEGTCLTPCVIILHYLCLVEYYLYYFLFSTSVSSPVVYVVFIHCIIYFLQRYPWR